VSTVGPCVNRMTLAQIREVASAAGFKGNDLDVACAVAMAESSGDPNCVGDLAITPGGSIGLWQINLRWHPEFDASMLTSPMYNAECAFRIYSVMKNSFQPWSTFKSGAYKKYMPQLSVEGNLQ
jgi:Lysozyme like domain